MEVLVDCDAALVDTLDACRIEGQVVDLGHASRGVNHKIADDLALLSPASSAHDELTPSPVDSHNRGAHLHVDSEIARGREKVTHEISVEAFERTIAAVKYLHRGTAAGRDVRELKGDVPAAHEGNPAGKLLQLQEPGTREEVLFSWDAERSMPGPCGNDHMTSIVSLAIHPEAVRTCELGTPLHCQDPGVAKACFS